MSPNQQTSLHEGSEEKEGEKGTGEINMKKSSEDCLPHVHTSATTTLSLSSGEIAQVCGIYMHGNQSVAASN